MATRAFLGAAVAVPQQSTLTLGGTWAQNDTITMTINNKGLVLTIGATFTTATILDNLIVMLTGVGTLGSGYSYNQKGTLVGEFAKLSYAEDGSTILTTTGPADGQPFTLATTKSSTLGTVSDATTVTPTGPHHFDDADNWSGATAPIDADTIVFDHRAAVSCKYALSQTAISPAKIIVADSFGPSLSIGLSEVNSDNTTYKHDEYLPTYLALGNVGDAQTITVEIDAQRANRVKLDTGTAQTNLFVTNSGTRADTDVPTVLWKGTHASNTATINRGDVGIAFFDGDSATVATLRVGYITNQPGDAVVVCGDGVTLTTINKAGGDLTTASACTTITQTIGTWTHLAGNVTTVNLLGGTFVNRSGGATITTIIVAGGALADFSRDNQGITITNATVSQNSGYKDPFGTVTLSNGLDFYLCEPDQLSVFEVKPHQTWTPSAI